MRLWPCPLDRPLTPDWPRSQGTTLDRSCSVFSEERLAPANGIEIAYQEIGDPDAEPLLLIMGLAVQMIGWDEEFCAMLAERGFRVVRFDNRDIGHSTKLESAGVPNVSTGNMEEGAFRCDANVSVRPAGQKEYGTKVEIKNMNSFKSVVAALKYEVIRQTAMLKSGERIPQETRGWDDIRNITVSQRTKEQAHDYRYFPEPDLPPLTFTPEQVEALRAELPELPDARRNRFMTQYNLSAYDANQLAGSRATADYFEQVVEGASNEHARVAASFVVNELPRLLGEEGGSIEESSLKPAILRELVNLVAEGTINHNIAKSLLPEIFKGWGLTKSNSERAWSGDYA